MASNLNYKQVVTVKRRTWDVEAYEQKAKARAAEAQADASAAAALNPHAGKKGRPTTADKDGNAPKRFKLGDNDNDEESKEEFKPAEPGAVGPMGSQRAFLQPRKGKIDIDSKIGETEIISAEAAATTSAKKEEGGVSVTVSHDVNHLYFQFCSFCHTTNNVLTCYIRLCYRME